VASLSTTVTGRGFQLAAQSTRVTYQLLAVNLTVVR